MEKTRDYYISSVETTAIINGKLVRLKGFVCDGTAESCYVTVPVDAWGNAQQFFSAEIAADQARFVGGDRVAVHSETIKVFKVTETLKAEEVEIIPAKIAAKIAA